MNIPIKENFPADYTAIQWWGKCHFWLTKVHFCSVRKDGSLIFQIVGEWR